MLHYLVSTVAQKGQTKQCQLAHVERVGYRAKSVEE